MATFSYADAVKLLGGNRSRIVDALDKLFGGALLAGSALGAPQLLALFDAKTDFVRLSHELVAKISDRRVSRYDRTQCLHAAHTVIVLVAFFEAFGELWIPVNVKDLDLTKQRQLDLGSRGSLLDTAVPLPSPEQPHERHLKHLGKYYDLLARDVIQAIRALAVVDRLNETVRARVDEVVLHELPVQALRRYEELFRRLATDFPEVAFWWALQDGQATRLEVGTALARLEQVLAPAAIGDSPAQRRAELAAKYQSVLHHPVIDADQAPFGLAIPSLQECYIDPLFQVCEAQPDTPFARTAWWDDKPVHHDIHRFLAGYLTSAKATSVPLLVLGDPGSGKSVLTKVLAAQLPASDFLVLRVELRTTPVEADILQQIEHGLRDVLQEQVSWPTLTRSAGPALPVILLDGFDELLQTTGVSNTDYLTKIARFQRDSEDIGRPVAVVVTSRISVADRAVAPDGAAVLRLAPFEAEQTEQWLDVWNKANARYFAEADVMPLSTTTVRRYPELSEQPLLLLMLALHDADGNALQRTSESIGKTELYERLLTGFARREVAKDGDHHTEEEAAAAAEQELERLSIVAFAMFNRGAQWVTEQHLDADLAALLDRQVANVGMRAPLGAGEMALGRFFFVQRAEATRDEKVLRTYEFLHATFGEYLVARATWRVLLDLVEVERTRPRRKFAGAVDDSELYALLSFVPLTERGSVIRFLVTMIENPVRRSAVDLLITLFRNADKPHPNRTLTDYEPVELSVVARYAVYSANLMLLAIVVNGELTARDLFGEDAEIAVRWPSQARLWRSQLKASSWQLLVDTVHVHRSRHDDRPDVRLRISTGTDAAPRVDVSWAWATDRTGVQYVRMSKSLVSRTAGLNFAAGTENDLMLHALEPLLDLAPDAATTFLQTTSGQWMSSLRALLALVAGTSDESATEHVDIAVGGDLARTWPVPEDVVFSMLRANPDRFDPYQLARFPSLTARPAFWAFLCDRIGKGGDDVRLTKLLYQVWDARTVFEEIPEQFLDAWLRMAERGRQVDLTVSSLLRVFEGADLRKLARDRPDLVKRARNALAGLGMLDAITWPD